MSPVSLRGRDSETSLDVLFRLSDVYTFCAFSIVDKLWMDTPCLTLQRGSQGLAVPLRTAVGCGD